MSEIKSIKAREILDSRGNPTLEVECITNLGSFYASVPSGASTGAKEAFELRDEGKRYGGKGVLKAINNVNEIIGPKLVGMDSREQLEIDQKMITIDCTDSKFNLGANAVVGVSMAVARAGAAAKEIQLYEHIAQLFGNKEIKIPQPCFNVINGGAHAGNDLDFQEFMIVPEGLNFFESLRMGSETYFQLKKILKSSYGHSSINVGDEGGFAPEIDLPEIALSLIVKAIEGADYSKKINIILDVAATQFFRKEVGINEGYYGLQTGVYDRANLLNYYSDTINEYPIIGIEDPFSEDDFKGFERMNSRIGSKIMRIGDDLTTSNPNNIKKAHESNACNAVILKINQVGTLTELLESARLAKEYGWKIIVSHRSGETCDSFIADLSVGISADYIKSGAPARGERLAKYNRLCKIEEEINKKKDHE
ncbi:MAG: phosphopyruvate hydratase [Candidatus Pacebacteria bacterium]|nr:phosphopyruvate hydratase [Candidatus Paceibacterota bacterium]